jgi:NADPH:quinone reductase-like Zn-dependent oxidoreductase
MLPSAPQWRRPRSIRQRDRGVPEHLSFSEASTLPVAGVTAWNALTGGRGLQSGETVLTLGSGGVSLFAIQFAKAFGARVIATTSTEEKVAALRALGADEGLKLLPGA